MNNVPIDHNESVEEKNSNENNENKEIDDQKNEINKEFENFNNLEEKKRKKELERKKKKLEEEQQKLDEYSKSRKQIKSIFIPKEEYKKDNFYDIIIKLNSLNELTLDGWEISYSQKFIEEREKYKNVVIIPVSVIGESNKGKSYLLAKISNSVLPEGFTEKTEGISVKYLITKYLQCALIDSAGGQTPIIKDEKNDKYFINLIKEILIKDGKNQLKKKYNINNEKENKKQTNKKKDKIDENNKQKDKNNNEEKFNEEIKKLIEEIKNKNVDLEKIKKKDENLFDRCLKNIILDKSITEQFIKDFVLNTSKIIFIVVGQLTITEQLFINNLKNNIEEGKQIIIIHNLLNFVKMKQVTDYIEEVLKKSIYFNLQERVMTELDIGVIDFKQKTNKIFYIEEFNNEETKKSITIRHVIFANDSKESEAGNYYNYSTIKFLQIIIMSVSNANQFDIVNDLIEYLEAKSLKYIELTSEQKLQDKKDEKNIIHPITKEHIKIEDIDDQKENKVKKSVMKIDNLSNLNLKRLITDESGNFKYTGNAFVPPYSYYKEVVKRNFLKKDFVGDEDVEVLVIAIELAGKIDDLRQKINEGKGKYFVTISGMKKLSEVNNISFLYSDIDENEFRIEFEINMDEYELKSSKLIKNNTKDGIIRLYYELKDKTETKEENIKINNKNENKINKDKNNEGKKNKNEKNPKKKKEEKKKDKDSNKTNSTSENNKENKK